MRIEDYEFEQEMTLTNLADLLEEIAEQIRKGNDLELPMPTRQEGTILVAIGEPVETGLEVKIRKQFIHVNIALAWSRPRLSEEVISDE
ncbi:MAG: hypothetical protein ACTSSE_14390 [Candidatus Thorarchaeota archaeon]